MRSLLALVAAGVLVVISVALADQVGRQSLPYDRSVDRGFAALIGPVGRASSATGAELAATLAAAGGATRLDLFTALGRESEAAAQEARRAAAVVPPQPAAGGAGACQQALGDRAQAAAQVEAIVDRLLGGATGRGSGAGDVASATGALTAVARQVAASDAAWSTCREALRRAPGHADLPRSAWLGDSGVWASGAPAAVVSSIATSPTLAAAPSLAIAALETDPPALSSAGSGVATLPAATSLGLAVVVDDTGNVALNGTQVTVTVTPSGAGRSVQRRVPVGRLGAGSSVVAQVHDVPVTPGGGATLTVTAGTTGAGAVGAPPATMAIQIEQASSTASVVASANPVTVGQAVTYTATISSAPAGAGPIDGTVAFEDAGVPIPSCQAQPLRRGTATCTISYPEAGVHSITVTYDGTTSIGGTVSPAITETVRAGRRPSSGTTG